MDLKTLQTKLIDLDRTAQDIIKECGYSDTTNSFERIKWNPTVPDECLLHDEIRGIMNVLGFIHYKLSYLKKPVTHEGVLQYNKKKGYTLDGVKLDYENRIEILALDEKTQNHKWELHHLTMHSNFSGVRARIRELGEGRE